MALVVLPQTQKCVSRYTQTILLPVFWPAFSSMVLFGFYDSVVEAGRKWPKYMTGGKPQKHFITAINTAVLGFWKLVFGRAVYGGGMGWPRPLESGTVLPLSRRAFAASWWLLAQSRRWVWSQKYVFARELLLMVRKTLLVNFLS